MKNGTSGVDVLFTLLKLLTAVVTILLVRLVDHTGARVWIVLGFGCIFSGFVMVHRSTRSLLMSRRST